MAVISRIIASFQSFHSLVLAVLVEKNTVDCLLETKKKMSRVAFNMRCRIFLSLLQIVEVSSEVPTFGVILMLSRG